MWVRQCHKPSSHHNFYRWYGYHSQSWVVYGIVLITLYNMYLYLSLSLFLSLSSSLVANVGSLSEFQLALAWWHAVTPVRKKRVRGWIPNECFDVHTSLAPGKIMKNQHTISHLQIDRLPSCKGLNIGFSSVTTCFFSQTTNVRCII